MRTSESPVDEGSQNTGAVVAEGLAGVGTLALEIDGTPGEQEGEEVGEVVPGFREQGQAVGAYSGDDQQDDVDQRHDQRNPQDLGGRPLSPAALTWTCMESV